MKNIKGIDVTLKGKVSVQVGTKSAKYLEENIKISY